MVSIDVEMYSFMFSIRTGECFGSVGVVIEDTLVVATVWWVASDGQV